MKKILSLVIAVMMIVTVFAVCIPAAAEDGFFATAELLQIKEHIEDDAGLNEYATVQGACSDGKYAYFAVQQGATSIVKYALKNWEPAKVRKNITDLGHANDMTYNADRGWILVANNGPDYDVLTALDPNTLKTVATVQLKIKVYSIAYNPDRDIYVAGISGGYKFALLDRDFKVIKKFKGEETGYTRQGCDCDENFIYFAQSGGRNAVVVYDYDGNYVDIVSLGHPHEVENLFHIGSYFYTTLHYYGNTVQRVGLSKSTQIRYNVYYDPGDGYGKMAKTSVHYGDRTALRKNTFKKAGYFFGGWRASRSTDGKYLGYRKNAHVSEWLNRKDVAEYKLYADRESVSETVKFGSVTMTPFWISENYVIRYNADGSDGWMPEATVGYYQSYVIPENGFELKGYIFAGFTARRDYDGRYYGYRKKSDIAEWLEEEDLYKSYEFKPGEEISSMTYDGTVILTPVFRFAYTYSHDNTTLIEYNGFDEIIDIPNPSGQLNTIASDAFHNNYIITELHIPTTVETMEPQAVTDLSLLRYVYFRDNFPDNFAEDSITDCDSPAVLVEYDGRMYFLGYAADKIDGQLLRFNAGALRLALSDKQSEKKSAAADK